MYEGLYICIIVLLNTSLSVLVSITNSISQWRQYLLKPKINSNKTPPVLVDFFMVVVSKKGSIILLLNTTRRLFTSAGESSRKSELLGVSGFHFSGPLQTLRRGHYQCSNDD